MKNTLLIAAIAMLIMIFSQDSKIEELENNSTIDFYLSYQIESVVSCEILTCLAKVRRKDQSLAATQTVNVPDSNMIPLGTDVYRTCTADLKTREVVCKRSLVVLDNVKPRYVRHPDWDLRPVADKVTYQ